MIRSGIFSLATVCLAISAPLTFRVLVPAFASAQEIPATQLPQIFIEAVTVTTTTPTIEGTFTAYNEETSVQSGLHYQIQLLGPAPTPVTGQLVADTAPEYDAIVSTERFTLLPGETKTIPFSYEPPQLPEGDYRLRVRWLTHQGRRLGWQDSTVHLGIPGAPFVLLESGPVILPDDRRAEPQEGVNVAPNSSLTVQGFATNIAAAPVTVTPRVTVYRWGITGEKVSEETLPALSLAAGETETLAFPLTTVSAPDAYHVVLTLLDQAGTRISSNALFRYVVTGASAKVVTARFAPLAIRQGASVTISADVVGPADRETIIQGSVDIALLDNQQVVAQKESAVSLDENVRTVTASFPLTADLTRPGLRITIRDAGGATLDMYEDTPELTAQQLAEVAKAPPADSSSLPKKASWMLIGALLIVAIVLLIIFAWYRHRFGRPNAPLPLAAVLMVGGALIGYGWYAQANGIQIRESGLASQQHTTNAISLFINAPRHNGSYSKTAVPVAVDVTYTACNNGLTRAEIQVLYNNAAGHIRSYPLPAGILTNRFSDSTLGCPGDRRGNAHCLHAWNGLIGNLSVGESFPHATTTLQLIGTWTPHSGRSIGSDVWNLFINLIPPPTLPPTPSAATCSPANQTTSVNVLTSFSASEPGLWSAPDGNPSSGQGTTFSTRYATPGNKTVTVAMATEQPTCSVQVVAPFPSTPTPTPTPTASGRPFNPGPITETE